MWNWIFSGFLLLVLAAWPEMTNAALVPIECSGKNAVTACGTCEFVSLVNNIIEFVIVTASAIAVLIFMYAGFLYVTSRGNTAQTSRANGFFTNVVIGYVILLSAYMIVNIVVTTTVDGKFTSILNWQQIECVYPNQSVVGTPRADGKPPIVLSDDDFLADAGVCSREVLEPVFGDRANAAACIAQKESGCGAKFYSRTDYDADGVSFSLSPWQINLTVHEVVGCGETLDCKAAYDGKNFDARIINQSLYDQCDAALRDLACAAKNAERIQSRRGSWKDWSTARACNLL